MSNPFDPFLPVHCLLLVLFVTVDAKVFLEVSIDNNLFVNPSLFCILLYQKSRGWHFIMPIL